MTLYCTCDTIYMDDLLTALTYLLMDPLLWYHIYNWPFTVMSCLWMASFWDVTFMDDPFSYIRSAFRGFCVTCHWAFIYNVWFVTYNLFSLWSVMDVQYLLCYMINGFSLCNLLFSHYFLCVFPFFVFCDKVFIFFVICDQIPLLSSHN